MKAKKLHDLAMLSLEDMKGQDIVSMNISKMSTIADFMLVVTATSSRHSRSLAEDLVKRCKAADVKVRMEGEEQGEWILIDMGDVIAHVMLAATRKLYDLESLWKFLPTR